MKILVTGGAGFIGSHVVQHCLEQGANVTVLDNLSTGFRDAVPGGELVVGDIRDRERVTDTIARNGIDVVMHFASRIDVAESRRDPNRYYQDNVVASLAFLDAIQSAGIKAFVFSSTAAVYGEPIEVPIPESHPRNPINPYGRTKSMIEDALADYQVHGLNSISLRYFNAAGSLADAGLGERHDPETHLVPLVLQAASGRRGAITIFGNDYDTPDGTCIRDYVHVADLAYAHWLAALSLQQEAGCRAYNLGSSNGFSNLEVLETARQVTGRNIPMQWGERRPGDPARLIADSTRARTELGWQPQHDSIETIIRDAWRWEQAKGSRW